MIIITRRPHLLSQVQKATAAWWGDKQRPVAQVRTLRDFPAPDTNPLSLRRHQLLIVDLDTATVHGDPYAAADILEWCKRFPWLHLVLVVGSADVRDQLHILDIVKTNRPNSSMIHGSEIGTAPLWNEIYRKAMTYQQSTEFHNAFLARIFERQMVLIQQDLVIRIMEVAPQANKVSALARLLSYDRKVLWRELTNAGQLDPSELLTLFHLLYGVQLRHHQWSPDVIGRVLGYRCSRDFMKSLKRRLGIDPNVFFAECTPNDVFVWSSHVVGTVGSNGRVMHAAPSLKKSVEIFVKECLYTLKTRTKPLLSAGGHAAITLLAIGRSLTDLVPEMGVLL